jgi:hypothetical protein
MILYTLSFTFLDSSREDPYGLLTLMYFPGFVQFRHIWDSSLTQIMETLFIIH